MKLYRTVLKYILVLVNQVPGTKLYYARYEIINKNNKIHMMSFKFLAKSYYQGGRFNQIYDQTLRIIPTSYILAAFTEYLFLLV